MPPPSRPAPAAGGQAAQRQRAEAVRVARGDQGAGGHHGEGEGADGPMEGLLHALRPGPAGGVGDQLGQHLGVAGGDELHALPVRSSRSQVALVRLPLWPSISSPGRRRRRPAARWGASCCQWSSSGCGRWRSGPPLPSVALQPGDRLLVEDLAHQAQPLVQREPRAVAGGDPGRLLAAVLQRVQADVGEAGHWVAWRVDADHAALFARAVGLEDGQRREALGGRVPLRVRRHHPRRAWGTA